MGPENQAQQQQQQPPPTYENRRMRRRAGRLQADFQESGRWDEAAVAGGADSAASPSSPPPRRLETHLWHAKRQGTVQRWGWALPEGDPGRGRGSRAFARRLRTGAALHDASYWCPLGLAGSAAALAGLLAGVLAPSEAAQLDLLGRGLDAAGGAWEQPVTLHRAGSWPRGAVGPALVAYLPAGAMPAAAMDEDGAEGQAEEQHQLLLWVHAAAAAEAHAALASALTARQAQGRLHLQVLNLRRLELRGRTADGALAAALQGSWGVGGGSPEGGDADAEEELPHASAATQQQAQLALPAWLAALGDGEAVQAVLPDPRLLRPVSLGSATAGPLLHSVSPADAGAAPGGIELRITQAKVAPPLPEAAVSAVRQRLRRELLSLPPAEEAQQQAEEAQGGTHCPVVLIRQDSAARTGTQGWSVVLPCGWVLPFWLALVFQGAKAIGQREWRWLHTLQGLPFFPHDFPDTQAYSSLMQQLAEEDRAWVAKRPKGKVAPPVARPPPWAGALRQQQQQQPPKEGAEEPGSAMEMDAPQQQQQQQQQQPEEQAGSAAVPLFVARTPCSLGAALWGKAGAGSEAALLDARQARPVRNALRQGRLQWQPVQGGPSGSPAGAAGAVLEVSVHVVKRGTAVEGAELCWVAGEEAAASAATLRLSGTGSSGAGHDGSAAEGAVSPGSLRTLGFVSSECPRGGSRASGALALCSAAALWRLRCLQHYGPARDRGVVRALLRNPHSSALHPVRLRLRLERAAGGGS